MVQANGGSLPPARARSPRMKPGAKKEQILEVATDYFGRYGYDETKWADVAAAVEIGSTALYHYFVVEAALPLREHGPEARRCRGSRAA